MDRSVGMRWVQLSWTVDGDLLGIPRGLLRERSLEGATFSLEVGQDGALMVASLRAM